jgi:hypothetical protein
MFSNDREEFRKVFFTAWQKHRAELPLEALESQLIAIMLLHPEYHPLLDNPQAIQPADFGAENPFLHMSLHLALREQISTDRPAGIRLVYAALCAKTGDVLDTEHRMMECLAGVLWEAQQNSQMPDESNYLEMLRQL